MGWVKLDDQFFLNRKVIEAGADGQLLYLSALTSIARDLTDGRLSQAQVRTAASLVDVRPGPTTRRLVEVGLWQTDGDGYVVPDYLVFNRSAAEENERREKERTKKARQRAAGAGKAVATGAVTNGTGGRFVSRDMSPGDTDGDVGRDTPRESPSTRPRTPSTDSSSSTTRAAPTGPAPEAPAEEETLAKTWDRLAHHDLATWLAEDDNHRCTNRTGWLTEAARRRQTTHDHDARIELAAQPTLTAEQLAEILDPACGPDDGGLARADQRAAEASARADAGRRFDAAHAAWTAEADQHLAALPADDLDQLRAKLAADVPAGPLHDRLVLVELRRHVMPDGSEPELDLAVREGA